MATEIEKQELIEILEEQIKQIKKNKQENYIGLVITWNIKDGCRMTSYTTDKN